MLGKTIIVFIVFIFLIAIVSCSWSIKRRFEIIETYPSETVAGWKFIPDIQSYRYIVQRGAPPDSGGVWLNLTAYHPKVEYRDTLYGVDIDTVFMYYSDTAEVFYTWTKQASAYGDPLEYKRLVRRFRFQDPRGIYHFFVPENVDTLTIEFDAHFYRGIMTAGKANTEYSTQYDTVVVDQARDDSYSRRIKMRLIKKISKTLVPSYF